MSMILLVNQASLVIMNTIDDDGDGDIGHRCRAAFE